MDASHCVGELFHYQRMDVQFLGGPREAALLLMFGASIEFDLQRHQQPLSLGKLDLQAADAVAER